MEIEIEDPLLNNNNNNNQKVVSDEAGSSSLSLSSENMNSNDYVDDTIEEEDDDDGAFDYDDDDGDYMFDNDQDNDNDDDDNDYLSMQAQFDNVDLPPGVEASFSWLGNPVSAEAKLGTDVASSSSVPVAVESPVCESAETKELVLSEEEMKIKYKDFKLFDIVADFSDHHFNGAGFQGLEPPRSWTKKIQDEWKILEKGLPGTIFVRVYETRMDLLRAVLMGPEGTPYHDGLFVFDVHFPPTYPDTPPMVYYYSGGLRLNPNLYDCGKVCLSLLNTWTGNGNEKWMPKKSTMLQVLVSIQALILNAKPFFNEPGYDDRYPGAEGERKSKAYNEEMFILSLKTMMYTLRRPPKHFEELVGLHFRTRAHAILSACRAYMEGVPVGSITDEKIPDEKSGSKSFQVAVARMLNGLISNFSRSGAADCDQFRV
ncbi:ubiquitin-conjugating enzyme/RWD-like protein [Artemisia annua]|uniref:E2 ubiquitin-conjugating enzyme n=1 Tax=Artemisia annua TaxID=35608 RepID=A0A2U1PEA2_ARTAN|nr:ubiquitin-conjugating enzyme/RWD-like protein [Artemisia annua]